MSGELIDQQQQQPSPATTTTTTTTATAPTKLEFTANDHHQHNNNNPSPNDAQETEPLSLPQSLPTPPSQHDLQHQPSHQPPQTLAQPIHPDHALAIANSIPLDTIQTPPPTTNGDPLPPSEHQQPIETVSPDDQPQPSPPLPEPLLATPSDAPTSIPPPPIVPLPDRVQIPQHPQVNRADSTSSLAVQPPTPAPQQPVVPPPVPAAAPLDVPSSAASTPQPVFESPAPSPALPQPVPEPEAPVATPPVPSPPVIVEQPAVPQPTPIVQEPVVAPPLPPQPQYIPAPSPSPAVVPSPSPAVAPSPSPAPVIPPTEQTPAPVLDDVTMGEAVPAPVVPQDSLKRSAPGVDEPSPVGVVESEERDIKRPRVESAELVASTSSPLLATPQPVSAQPSASPSPSPALSSGPVSGYDPSAFTVAPAAPLVPPPPTISPTDLNLGVQPSYPSPAPQSVPSPAAAPIAAPQTAGGAPQNLLLWDALGQPIPAPGSLPAPRQFIPGPVPVMTKPQHKAGLNLLRTLKKNRSAPPFLRPVDPIALHIPDYPRVILQPMDLGTVEAKLMATGKAMAHAAKVGRTYGLDYSGGMGEWEGKADNVYRTVAEFKADVDLVWNNCFRYNGPKEQNAVSAMAGALQEVSDKLFKTLPAAPAIEYIPEPPRPPTPDVVKKERRPSNSFVPTIRRSEEGSRPKREIHAPARELPYEQDGTGKSRTGRVSGKVAQEQLKFCKEVIKEIFKKTHEPYAYVFYEPVNYVALNIPQYPSIIKKPMDFGTIKAKLEQNMYAAPAYVPFEADARQVFKNCYIFNPAGTMVHEWGKKLEAVFDAKWAERPTGTGDDDDDASDDDGISAMERQLATMQANLEAMKAGKKAAKEEKRAAERALAQKPPKASTSKKVSGAGRERAGSTATAPRKRQSGGGAGGPGKKGKKARKNRDTSDEEEFDDYLQPAAVAPVAPEEVTFEMKRELAVKIVSFDGEKLEQAIEIIRRGRPDLLSDANKEIELDIDQLDQTTLLNLYRFVCPQPPKKGKAAAAGKRGAGAAGGTKRKNLDEVRESERIEMLEQRLRDFENTAAGGGAAGAGDARRNSSAPAPGDADQASSDSSSDEDSGSESDDDD
ncbi:hypothetical protein T439DRAFT_320903 [Meredithblackwellia eburnea MCA 4105]